jgi:hypothetical protein
MAEDTVFTAFGEHAALHIARVCNCSIVSEEKVSCMSQSTDHLGNRHPSTSPSLCGKCQSSDKCLEFPAVWSTGFQYDWHALVWLTLCLQAPPILRARNSGDDTSSAAKARAVKAMME